MAHESSFTPRELECMLCDKMAEPKALPLSLLKEITNSFSDEQRIGKGAFAVVYKGEFENGIVAVKRMSHTHMFEIEFQREVECLMIVKHKNIVRFLGYCADTQGNVARHEGKFVMADVLQRLLCFEYLPKGSLDKYITDTSRGLRWINRYQIITGICQGLHYLHQKHIVHLDLKPANILLDDNWVPKITDFGISRCFHEMQSQVMTKIGGTPGYWAPEAYNNTALTYRQSYMLDIYSLGVVIMEILTGERGDHDVDKVVESWSNMLGQSQSNVQLAQVRVCAEIGIECKNFDPAKRPDMQRIINRLDETETMNEYIETGVITSQQVECAPNELHQDMPNFQGEASSKLPDVVDGGKSLELPNIGRATSLTTLRKFTVRKGHGHDIKQLRDLNKLSGSLEIDGLENVKSKEDALEANLSAKERLTHLTLRWGFSNDDMGGILSEVQAEVLESLCPPAGLRKLCIRSYGGSRCPYWMQNGGPRGLQKLEISHFTPLGTSAPQLVEAFPQLRVLRLFNCSWDALPSNMEHLTRLNKLVIDGCNNIRSLPTLPRSLEKFEIGSCNDEFMESCQTTGHPNCEKLEHIPRVIFCESSNCY